MATSSVAGREVRFVARPVPRGEPSRPLAGAVMHAVGSRSESVRLAPVVSALAERGTPQVVACPVGADGLPDAVFESSGLPRTSALLDPRKESGVTRVAHSLAAAERLLEADLPKLVVLSGDSDRTLAFGLAARKLGVRIARVGAGLRCGDFSLPEEINRILGDELADVLFTEDALGEANLRHEGVAAEHIHTVGSTTADIVSRWCAAAQRRAAWNRIGVPRSGYVLATLHRTENLCSGDRVEAIAAALADLAGRVPVVFVMHPWTLERMRPDGVLERLGKAGVRVCPPLDYLDFLSLEESAGSILTDSSGVQEEASVLGVRCHTLRRVTERLATLTHGSNVLLGDDPRQIAEISLKAGRERTPERDRPRPGAARRIAAILDGGAGS